MHAYSISYYSFWTKIANQCVLSLYLGCSLCAVKNKGEVLLRLEIKTFSYFPLFLYFPIYIFNRTSSLWGGISPKWRGKLESEIGGNLSPKLGGSCAGFQFQIWCGDRSHCSWQNSVSIIFTSAKEVMFLSEFVCLSVCLCVSKVTQKVMDRSFWNFLGMSGMAKTTSDIVLGMIRKESWILDHFKIFVNIAFNGA